MAFELPTLPYSISALAELGMSQETFEYHYAKHHNAYIVALNGLVEKNEALHGKSLEELVLMSSANAELTPVFNNAGQTLNHNQFWLSLSPKGGKIPSKLEAKIVEDFGSVAAFKEAFKQAGVTQFGSGWAWLVLSPEGKLKVTKSANASTPLATGEGKVLMTYDVWEHAYYIDFRNRRPDYITNFLDKLANYEYAEANLLSA
jgi:Fe-Mn family superoxide dismutase